ncbi:MAG: bifunctional diguanylate cyclase/phosphodiesterase [Lachnospiraceae bacterium]|nr:bifunctional diguanylate cyclase/phosphodiesterase [Lachnospiraceae bacterium]
MENQRENILITYDCKSEKFQYPDSMEKHFAARFDNRSLGQIMKEDRFASKEDVEQFDKMLNEIAGADTPQVFFAEYKLKAADQSWKWYRFGFVCTIPQDLISITVTNMEREIAESSHFVQLSEYDELTGLYNMKGFSKYVELAANQDEAGVSAGKYAVICFDVIRFKAINDIFGVAKGNKLLQYIAQVIRETLKSGDFACRSISDHFVIFTHTEGNELEDMIEQMLEKIEGYELPFVINCNVGIYITNGERLSVDAMIDRAILAQSVIKGSYMEKYSYYTEALRNDMLGEQEIIAMVETAIAQEQFVAFYQPQYNHSNGMLIGAEALVRWNHPEKGLISPGVFIPICEKNGFITRLDLYVFEQTCKFIRKCMDKGIPVVPISSNFSRNDIFQPNYVEKLEEIRKKYEVPAKYLRVEITESTVVGGIKQVNKIIEQLHECGYLVEMDDFGSGYSSLNVLKDISFDIIKLDMMFLREETESNRGGIIVSAVMRMAKWLGMPVIAEGVETVKQADFLRSIGCESIQGYLYSKPLPEDQYEEKLRNSTVGENIQQMRLIDTINACDFWNPKSRETLIFSNFVGGAAIFDYHDGKIEILRVNQKYLQEIGLNQSEKEFIKTDPLSTLDEANRKIYHAMLEQAIQSMDEEECETWRELSSSCCGEERICIRSNVRVIGKSDDDYLFYAMIRNITAEKNRFEEILDSERRFKMASEQVNIYYWEYTVATKEMRPCFRCMRDLGLPAVLTNYPDSAIEMGIFPPEVADMYRDWHRQIAEGVKELEAIIPLTVGRVPFHVRYTTEFDENGRPVKAYGSAALVVDS